MKYTPIHEGRERVTHLRVARYTGFHSTKPPLQFICEANSIIFQRRSGETHFTLFSELSDDCFVMAFPAETTEAFLEGHVQAFAYFGGVPTCILYDNTKLAVAKILGDGSRQKTRAFSELQSHYLFAEKFRRPGKGNDKGKVERLVGYARRNFMVTIPPLTPGDRSDFGSSFRS